MVQNYEILSNFAALLRSRLQIVPKKVKLNELTAVSPIDGRYRGKTQNLAYYFSEYALIRYRVRVEIEYFIALCESGLPQLAGVSGTLFESLQQICRDFGEDDAVHIKEIEKVTKLLEAGVFDGPKPVRLIRRLLTLANLDKDSLILDFFAGSATTAHAIMELNKEDSGNRKYILVQIPEPCDEKSKAYKVGYKTIADIAKERIRRAGKKLQYEIETENKKKETLLNFDNQENQRTSVDIGFKVFRLTESSFKQWKQLENYSAETLSEQMKLFIDPVAENANLQNMVYELLLKSGKDLNVNIEICNGYHLIEGNELALILEKVDEQIITEVLSKQPQKVIVLDRIFKGNDQLKTNTALQMKDAGVEFKTI
jgi:adenine-specific DNA-methyltransferase